MYVVEGIRFTHIQPIPKGFVHFKLCKGRPRPHITYAHPFSDPHVLKATGAPAMGWREKMSQHKV